MPLTSIEESLILAAYFRGGHPDDRGWISNSDQIVTLSLFYTGDISSAECANRFATGFVGELYDEAGELTGEIEVRYYLLINLLQHHPDLIKGGGNLKSPAHPTYTACRLTHAGMKLAADLSSRFPLKPDFPNWPDKRTMSDAIK